MTSRILRSPKTSSLTFDRVGSRVEGRGAPVVLLHSSMSSKGQWRELIQRMRDRHRLIAIDLHGYGETSLPQSADCFTLNDEVRLVESVLTSALRAGERFHLVGHSYGGVVALQLAQGQPHRVRSLSLFEPMPFHLLPEGDSGLAELHSVWHQIEASLKSDDACGGAACFIDYWSGRGTFSQMSEGRQAAMCRLLPKTALEFRAVAREALRGDAYRRIVAPACLIAGRWSPRSAHASISVLAELLPHARQHQVAAGHMAPVTHPALVNPIIERFIRDADGAATPSGHWEALPSESQWPQTAALCLESPSITREAMKTNSLSYVHGGSDVPLIGETLGVFFDKIVERFGEREALVVRHQNVRWTYRELQRRANNLAASLIRLKLTPGERIGIWSQNNSEWLLTQLATAKVGLILVNLNPAYRRAELEYALNKVQCKALIVSPRFKSSDYLVILQELAPELRDCEPGRLIAARLPALEFVIRLGSDKTPGMLNFDELLSDASAHEQAGLDALGETLQFDDPINIQFTSGTTGAPKAATLTHHNILNNGFFVGQAMQFSENDRLCIPVPLYHIFGMVLGNLACMTHGATMVYPGEAFDAKSVLETIEAERCTALHGVPTMFIAELDHPKFARYDLSSLRTGIMAGAPCPVEVMKKVVERMHMRQVTIAYGMTETSPISFQSSIDDPIDRRVSTVGRVQPHLEVKIVDDEGRVVPRGAKGELLTRGYSVMRGYWGDSETTREAIDAGGWMHSGDLATIDGAGYCNIVGRSKDMVIRGGENIYPREVEEFLYQHPKVLDVQCVGVPDAKYGEELCACIILRPGVRAGEEEIRAFCRGHIAHYKVPRYVMFVDAFPMTITGKIQKFLLREQMAEVLDLKEEVTA